MVPTSLTPEIVLQGYRMGIFPMAEPEDDNAIYWYAPDRRAIIPLGGFRMSRRLARTIRSGLFEVTSDRDFEGVMRCCAGPRGDGTGTWISEELIQVYTELHRTGFGHSIECYHEGELAGGLYGVSLGAAFFGESMFHRRRDASKVALAYLVATLRANGHRLLDVQFLTEHLKRLGAVEIPRLNYEARLAQALCRRSTWQLTAPAV